MKSTCVVRKQCAHYVLHGSTIYTTRAARQCEEDARFPTVTGKNTDVPLAASCLTNGVCSMLEAII